MHFLDFIHRFEEEYCLIVCSVGVVCIGAHIISGDQRYLRVGLDKLFLHLQPLAQHFLNAHFSLRSCGSSHASIANCKVRRSRDLAQRCLGIHEVSPLDRLPRSGRLCARLRCLLLQSYLRLRLRLSLLLTDPIHH